MYLQAKLAMNDGCFNKIMSLETGSALVFSLKWDKSEKFRLDHEQQLMKALLKWQGIKIPIFAP